jgi:hypothetical protein
MQPATGQDRNGLLLRDPDTRELRATINSHVSDDICHMRDASTTQRPSDDVAELRHGQRHGQMVTDVDS